MSTPWTPGPWSLASDDLRGGTYWSVRIGQDGHDPIDLHEDDNGAANARLIAAAPDLADALAAIVDCFGVGHRDAASFVKIVRCHIEDARSALAKARGEQ